MSNPFDVLSNDVEDANDFSVPREIVKQSTSSKKKDAAPPKANPDRARKNRPQPTGNDAAFKDKSAGRAANKAKGVEEPKASRKPTKEGKTDRHSKSGKTDSSKKVKQAGWTADGDAELEAEVEGAEDAAEELAEETEPKQVKKSLEDYLKEQESTTPAVARPTRTVEAVNEDDIILKEQEVFIQATKTKSLKSKTLKTKTFLDIDATFSDDLPRSTPSRGGARGSARGGARGDSRGGRGGARGRGNNSRAPRGNSAPKSSQAPAPAINDVNFPSLA